MDLLLFLTDYQDSSWFLDGLLFDCAVRNGMLRNGGS